MAKIATEGNETPVMAPTFPWESWEDPRVTVAPINSLKVERENNQLYVVGEERLGLLDETGLRALGEHASWPTDFIMKLPIEVQEMVIQARLDEANPNNLQFITDPSGELKSVVTEWRAALSHKTVAQTFYDALSEEFGELVIRDVHLNGKLTMTLMTPRNDEITPREGDVLNYGVTLTHQNAHSLSAQLFMDRLWCANGAYSPHEVMSWRSRDNTSAESQIEWIRNAMRSAKTSMDLVTANSRTMAQTQFSGDYRSVLLERARALGVPASVIPRVYAAFEQEPGDTEWHLLNALTRFATHDQEAGASIRRRVQNQAGTMIREYDLVEARLPRTVARRVGATILEN